MLTGLGRSLVPSDSTEDRGMGDGELVEGPHSIHPHCSFPVDPHLLPFPGLEDPLNPCLPLPFSTGQTHSLGTSSNTVPPSSPQPLPHNTCFPLEAGVPPRFPWRSDWRPIFQRPRTSQPEEEQTTERHSPSFPPRVCLLDIVETRVLIPRVPTGCYGHPEVVCNPWV